MKAKIQERGNRYLLWQGNAAVVDIDTSGDMCAADVLEHVAYWLREEPRNDYRLEILPCASRNRDALLGEECGECGRIRGTHRYDCGGAHG